MILAFSQAFPEVFSEMQNLISNIETNYNVQQGLSSFSSLAIEHLIIFTLVALWGAKILLHTSYTLPPWIGTKFLPNKGEMGRLKKRAQLALEE